MHSMEQLVDYLNNYFAVQTWSAAADLIGNLAISQTDAAIRDRAPLLDGLKDFEINFTRSPSVEIADDTSVRIRLPQDGRHRLKTEIELDVLPNPELRADFRHEILAHAAPPNVNIDVDTNFHWGSNIAAAILLGPLAVATKRVLEESAEEIISAVMENQLRNNINGLETYRFDRSIDLVWHPDMQDPISLVRPDGNHSDPQARGYIDILLVADGFSQENMEEFTAFADEVADHFYNSAEVPFRNFRSAIRIWQMPLVVVNPDDPLQRAAVPFADPSGASTMSFSNLARVAEIGLIAQETLWRDPIVVFTSRETGTVRANAPGPYVLLHFRPGSGPVNRAMTARKILIHELGHTPLSRILADEYSTGLPIYRGPEPAARNVSTNAFAAQSKWQPWTGISGSMAPLANQGAYMHGEGIFRFQDQCRMRTTTTGDFCPVCREQLAVGMLDWGHYAIGGGSGWADVRFEYLSPWVEIIERHLLALSNDEVNDLGDESREKVDEHFASYYLPVFSAHPWAESDKYPTRIRLTVVASSVPENWEVILEIRDGGRIIAASGISAEFLVTPGSDVRLIIRHGGSVPEILSGEQAIPEFDTGSGRPDALRFRNSRQVLADDLTPPTDLIQSVDLGARLVPVIDPANGSLSYPEELWLAATLGGIRTYTLPAVLEIKLEGPGNFEDEFRSAEGNQGERRRWQLNQMVPSGQYVWSARMVWGTLATQWVQAPRGNAGYCFEIGDIPFEEQPRPPAKPFDVTILETATVPSRPVGLAASSWHPNDKPIKFQFEVKKNDDAWNEQGLLETADVQRDPLNYQTLAVTGRVSLSVPAPEPVVYKWRARAADPDNRMTDWVEGRPFALLTTGRPIPIDDWTRMLERLERFDHVLDPNGPRDSPHLFVDDGTIPVRRRR